MNKTETIALRLWWSGIVGLLLGLCWVSWPYAVSAYYLERGTHSLDSGALDQAISDLVIASNFESKNSLVSRRLAQAYLQSDEMDQALAAAQQAVTSASDHPLVQLEMGDVYDRLGETEQAIARYEAGQVGDRQVQFIANYLQLAERLWDSGDQVGAVAIWQNKVRGYGYGDLYANWRLAQYYADNQEAAAPYQDGVRYFPLSSVAVPPDRRLDPYQAQAFVGAAADGLWTHDTLLKVLAYRVWQDQSQSTENLLRILLDKNPSDVDLRFYLGEMYHRRGDGEQAEIAYQQVLDIDQSYVQAYLRLGIVAETSCESRVISCVGLEKAARWYEQYHQLAPNDLLGLRKLAEIYETLHKPEVVTLWTEFEASADDRRLVAGALHIGLDEFELSDNLLKAMKFQDGQLIPDEGWQWGSWLGSTGDDALFFSDQDWQGDKSIARIINLWYRPLAEDIGWPYVEYDYDFWFEANTYYVLSFFYQARNFQEDRAFVGMFEYVGQPRFSFAYSYLPDTGGTWQKKIFVGPSYEAPIAVRLMLRNSGTGDMLFDQIELRQVNFRH